MPVLIAVEVNPIGFTKSLSCTELYTSLTDVEFPIPDSIFGSTFKDTISPMFKPCEVETDTVVLIFLTLPVICVERPAI